MRAQRQPIIVGGVQFEPKDVGESLISGTKDTRGVFLCRSKAAIIVALHDGSMPSQKCKAYALEAAAYFKDLEEKNKIA